MDHHSWGPIEYGTTLCTVRHVYRNGDRCILYEEANVVLLYSTDERSISTNQSLCL